MRIPHVRLWLSPFFIRDLGAPSLRTIECSESLSFFGSSSILNLSRDIGCSILVGTECRRTLPGVDSSHSLSGTTEDIWLEFTKKSVAHYSFDIASDQLILPFH